MGLVCLQIWIGTLIVASSIHLSFCLSQSQMVGYLILPKEPMCQFIFSTIMVNAKEVQYNPNVVRLVGHINDEPTIDRFKKSTHEIL
jgi:hypothetical protein